MCGWTSGGGRPYKAARVRRFFQSEAGAVLLWVAASVLLAAVIAPWFYQGGRWFHGVAEDKEWGGIAGWLAAAAGRADLNRYFNRSLLVGALVLLPPLLRRVRKLKRERRARGEVLPKRRRTGMIERVLLWAGGVMVAFGVVWSLGFLLNWWGAFAVQAVQVTPRKLISAAVLPALGVSLAEEALFRGVLLGLWLRVARPMTACVGSSLVFAAMHFLSPAPGYVILDPASPVAGFELLGAMLRHYADPAFFVADFLTLVGVGLVLACGRLRTGSLWLPVGLHCGWVLAFKSYHLTHFRVLDSPVGPLLVGQGLRSGLLPLAALLLTALICHGVLRWIGYPGTRVPEQLPLGQSPRSA